ncbi:MAG: tetratricopeptide repeat protein [Cyclobacteriaceae bacterium]|nr:tetratricopeptide repeat protein [Cyclobacteriaceae bacterium]
MKRAGLLIVLYLICNAFAFAQHASVKKSKRLIAVDHGTEAMAPVEAAIRENPKAADLYYYLGYAQLKNNQLDAAAKSFDAGIAKNPKEAINYAGKGHLALLQNNVGEAKINLDKALKLSKSKKVPVLKAVAEAYLTQPQRANEAVALLLKAKSIKDDAEVEILLGDAYLAQNQAGSAVSAYENAAAMDVKNGEPYYKIGMIYTRVNPAMSQQSFEKAVAVDPEFTYAYDELADIYYQQKEADKAVAAAEKFRQLSSDPEKIKMRLAFIYVMQGEYAKGNQLFEELVAKDDVKPIVYRYYVKSLQATKDSTDSITSATVSERFLTTAKPEDITPKDYIELGKLYIALGNDSLGESQLTKAVQLDPKSPDAVQAQAEIYYKNKKYSEAADAYKRLVAVKEKPSPNEFLNMARAYSMTEQYQQADTVYTQLVEQYPTNIQVTVEAARVKANIDSTQEAGLAKPLYEKVLELANAAPEKNKTFIIESYKYLGSYYAISEGNLAKGKEYFQKVLALNPADQQAKEVLEAIRQGAIQRQKGTGD